METQPGALFRVGNGGQGLHGAEAIPRFGGFQKEHGEIPRCSQHDKRVVCYAPSGCGSHGGCAGERKRRAFAAQSLLSYLSERSERGAMTTYMQLARIPLNSEDGRQVVHMTQDEEYLRHVESSVKDAQTAVARVLQTWKGSGMQEFEDGVLNGLTT